MAAVTGAPTSAPRGSVSTSARTARCLDSSSPAWGTGSASADPAAPRTGLQPERGVHGGAHHGDGVRAAGPSRAVRGRGEHGIVGWTGPHRGDPARAAQHDGRGRLRFLGLADPLRHRRRTRRRRLRAAPQGDDGPAPGDRFQDAPEPRGSADLPAGREHRPLPHGDDVLAGVPQEHPCTCQARPASPQYRWPICSAAARRPSWRPCCWTGQARSGVSPGCRGESGPAGAGVKKFTRWMSVIGESNGSRGRPEVHFDP